MHELDDPPQHAQYFLELIKRNISDENGQVTQSQRNDDIDDRLEQEILLWPTRTLTGFEGVLHEQVMVIVLVNALMIGVSKGRSIADELILELEFLGGDALDTLGIFRVANTD